MQAVPQDSLLAWERNKPYAMDKDGIDADNGCCGLFMRNWIGISNVNIPPHPNLPAISFNVSVTVQSVSTTSFTFVTNPGHVLDPATITFSGRDAGRGRIGFSINVNGEFASRLHQGMYYLGGDDLEDKIWNNLIDNVQRSCGSKK